MMLEQQISAGWGTPAVVSARKKLLKASKSPGYYTFDFTEGELAELVNTLGDYLSGH